VQIKACSCAILGEDESLKTDLMNCNRAAVVTFRPTVLTMVPSVMNLRLHLGVSLLQSEAQRYPVYTRVTLAVLHVSHTSQGLSRLSTSFV
jgi:hypothetical protein